MFGLRPPHFLVAVIVAGCLVFTAPAYGLSWLQKPPGTIVKRHQVIPLAHPSPAQVVQIAKAEQARWGGPSPLRRINCESGYRWDAVNGPYRGLLQFGPVWQSMWPGTPRRVVEVRVKHRKARAKRFTLRLDGTIKKSRGPKVRQRVIMIRRGMLPRYPSPFHGHAAIRVHQRAIAGVIPSTGWECPL